MRVLRVQPKDLPEWATLRHALWPAASEEQHLQETQGMLNDRDCVAFIVRTENGALAGFAEVSIRHDGANGCETRPVGFLEGIYVQPRFRRRGAARELCRAAEAWVSARGCSEFGSDTELHNKASQQMHLALGFEETERVVFYRKGLPLAGT